MFHQSRIFIVTLGLALFNTSLWAGTLQVNNNGSVTDLASGLVWQQQDDGVTRTHDDAVAYCNGLSLAGSSNWRLPTVKELSSIIDHRVESPSIDVTAFPNTQSTNYRSASFIATPSGNAWSVSFMVGVLNASSISNSTANYVRCVR